MKEVNFKYEKNGKQTERKVLVIEEKDDFIAGIDYTHLTNDKANSLRAMAKSKTDEFDPKNYMDAFRRFNRSKVSNLKEEIL